MTAMSIPRYDEMFSPLLDLMKDGQTKGKSELIQPMAAHFGLSEEQQQQSYDTSGVAIFTDRMSWTLSYLSMSGLLERPARAQYRLSESGKAWVGKANDEVKAFVRSSAKSRPATQTATPGAAGGAASSELGDSQTPKDMLISRHREYCKAVQADILATILEKSPSSLEKLAVELVQKMGYGASAEHAGRVTPLSGDGGIDGEIIDDVLGFGRIFIQTKRYRDTIVGRPDIQAFAGALQGVKADRGIFITTSRFSQDARKYAESLSHTRIVLIDGDQLAEYIYRFGVGMQIRETFVLKELDENYWNELAQDQSRVDGKHA